MSDILPTLAFGIVFGTTGGLSPGPTLTLVVVQTLRYDVREGCKVAISPLLTDAPIVLAAVLAVGRIGAPAVLGVLALCGAAFLAWLARESLRAGPLPQAAGRAGRPGSIRKGFLANLLNPHPWAFWLTVGGPTTVEAWRARPAAAVAFIAALYVCLVGSKLLVAVLVDRGRTLLDRGYFWTLRALGIVLGGFALVYVFEGLRYLGAL